ncbi:hypothetical protein M405DRAFT_175480 [Rhizopogon salebrosus TDB-379]|nr:hypothetical protein M405DRAFT_175480 [Rhizopogon salebrosus TDB-379]
MRSSNFAGAPVFRSNRTSRHNLNPDHWTPSVLTAWQSGLNVHSLDQYLSTDFTFSQEFPEVLQFQCHTTDLTGRHTIHENFLSSQSDTTNNDQVYYPSELRDYNPLPADDSLAEAYEWNHANSPSGWLGPDELPLSFRAMVSQLSMDQLPVVTPPHASSQSPGVYVSVCDWIENDIPCGQTISGDILGTHLRNAHNVRGNEKRMLVCHWRNCDQELQRNGMRRHVATRHLNLKSHCYYCFKPYSRRDAMTKHARECQREPPSVVGPARPFLTSSV